MLFSIILLNTEKGPGKKNNKPTYTIYQFKAIGA